MAKLRDTLGMNSRNLIYLRLNKKKGRKIADSKLLTKKVLTKNKVPHPRLITILNSYSDIQSFDWLQLRGGFVIKPSEGFGGEGIMVVKKASKYAGEWILMNGQRVRLGDLKLHAGDILEGQYSRNKAPDKAFIEERVEIHPKFLKYAEGGTPDVRIIVYNHIPIMAMLRLPTKESNGKANLHQGAVGLGIDMATGITTHGVHYDSVINFIPGTTKKVNGLAIPQWDELLKVAIDAQIVSGLGYIGIDIVLDEHKGPMVLELNDQPGLQIQLANQKGLLRRLRRVEDLEVIQPYKGIQIAEILFAERFSDKVKIDKGRRIVGIFEKVEVKVDKHKSHEVIAKIDTGAESISIDRRLAEELGLLKPEHILWETEVRSALGKEKRPVIELVFWLQGRRIKALATVSNRRNLRVPLLIGRNYLTDFMIDPSIEKNY